MINLSKKIYNHLTGSMTLNSKLLFSYFVLSAIPTLVITFFLYGKVFDIIKTDTLNSDYTLCQQTTNTIEATLTQVTNVADSIINNTYFQRLMSDEASAFMNEAGFEEQTRTFLKYLEDSVDHQLITDIKIYTDIPNYEAFREKYIFYRSFITPLSESTGTYWHGIFCGTSSSSLYCPTFYLSKQETEDYGSLAYICKLRNNSDKSKTKAFIAVYFSEDAFKKILKQNQSDVQNMFYIINGRNNLVASSSQQTLASYLIDINELDMTIFPSGQDTETTRRDLDVYSSRHIIPGTDWYLVSVIPYDSLTQESLSVVSKYLLLYFGVVVITFFVSLQITRSITARVSSVIHQMSKTRFGKPVKMPQDMQHDEISDLIDTYNYMASKIEDLLIEQEESAKQLRTSEFNALQAQINPHFLYNTLDMINWLSISDQKQEVSAAIQSLSKFYKLTLSKKDTIGTVAEELEHASLYVQLQNMRYQQKIEFIVDIPAELLDYRMPKLTFQPIIENSIQHGIFGREDKAGTIVLTGWMENQDIIFLISDNGIGMDKKQLSLILKGEGKNTTGSNIGVYNTHQRLRLFYGEAYGLHYESNMGQGTEVLIRLPARNE